MVISNAHTDAINALIVLENGDLASGSSDLKINIWNPNTGALKRQLVDGSAPILDLLQLKTGEVN